MKRMVDVWVDVKKIGPLISLDLQRLGWTGFEREEWNRFDPNSMICFRRSRHDLVG